MRKRLLSVILVMCVGLAVNAQELNCRVTILHDKITGVDNQVFVNMTKSLNDFMNSHKWGTDEFATAEKIDCNVLINLVTSNANGDPDSYTATLSIQASRPVYNTSYTSSLINYVDKDVMFKFSPFNAVRFDDNQVAGIDPSTSNLTAILAYYAYLTMAMDYDSFSPSGGTAFLKKAQNVVNNAPDGKGISGWKPVESTRNRYWIVDQLLNTRFQDVRNYWYSMHREGLDSMSMKPVEARNRILAGIRKIYEVNKENPNSIVLQFFFNAKTDELQHLLAQAPKADRGAYITLLSAADVPDAAKYNALK